MDGWSLEDQYKNNVFLQRNPCSGETLEQVHITCWKVIKYDEQTYVIAVSNGELFERPS